MLVLGGMVLADLMFVLGGMVMVFTVRLVLGSLVLASMLVVIMVVVAVEDLLEEGILVFELRGVYIEPRVRIWGLEGLSKKSRTFSHRGQI